ncbi:hypothetical protein CUR178_06470 [Leishmania enriettii]|uniref:Ankyrin repeats (3 copies) family protein n=1 Tax=Leishmania enriettii TaxID=5663 RepID=A0A836KQ00_LEIEN|nr:hypothetical protein CUR178_06470 [Leishmania enriettii]
MDTSIGALATAATDPPVAGRKLNTVQCAPQQPCNAALQAEAATFLMHGKVADAAAGLSKHDLQSLAVCQKQPSIPPELLIELEDGEQVGYPPSKALLHGSATAAAVANSSVTLPGKLNPCACTTDAFDAWLRAVVQSIPTSAESNGARKHGDGRRRPGSGVSRGKTDCATEVSREQTLYTALELLETAARLLQRRTILCHGQDRLLHAYYDALEEDIRQYAKAMTVSIAAQGTAHRTASTPLQQLLPPVQHKFSPYHHHLRMHKRGVPLQHNTEEQRKLQDRLEKLYYVLLKLEEVEGVSNSILGEGQRAPLLIQSQCQNKDDLRSGGSKAESVAGPGAGKNTISAGSNTDSPGALELTCSSRGGGEESDAAMGDPTLPSSRRLAAMECRVRRLRRQLRLPLAASRVTSRLRNELILSFSARVLALREPAPFTSEIYVPAAAAAAVASSAPQLSDDAALQKQSSHSMSAFVEWYVQRVMDPLAISQLLSIVPRDCVVTTTCRLVYACEAHASLRSSRALPDLGPVLLHAVAEGRADVVSQLLLSSSVSYRSALAHPMDCQTCFFSGLLGGQLDVLTRLVEQQSWHVNALHVLLFMSAPWNTASAPMVSRGCYVYQRTLLGRIQAFLSVAERALAIGSPALTGTSTFSFEENATDSPNISISGGGDCEGGDAALAALRTAQLLGANAEGEKLMATLGDLFGSGLSSEVAPAARGGHKNGNKGGARGADGDRESTGSSSASVSSMLSMIPASRAAAAAPPVFLSGALNRLRLFLAVRSATLQYERQQQDLQWAKLLDNVKSARTGGGDACPAVASTTHGLGSSNKNLPGLQPSLPEHLHDPTTVSARTDHGEASFSSAIESSFSFAHVLHQHQLDAFTAVALCPLRCQMCPSFTTPQLQRVDAWSYGPLQPTIATATPLSTMNGTGSEGGATQSSEQLVSLAEQERALNGVVEDDRRSNDQLRDRLHSRSILPSTRRRPITALLIRSDTAFDMKARSWHTYPAVGQAVVAEGREHYESSSQSGELNMNTHGASKPDADRQSARKTRRQRLVSPWHSCRTTGVLLSSLPFRYSFSLPLEDVRRVAQDVKQRRAARTLYGSAAVGVGGKSIFDHDDGGGSDDYQHQMCGAGSVALNPTDLHACSAPPPPAMPDLYYEVQMSAEYLVALYAADQLGATSHDIGSVALAHSASSPLSEDAVQRLCANCVVVGLCDAITAAQANGCTHGPSKPHVVTHLGHKLGGGDVVEAMERGRGGDDSGLAAGGDSTSDESDTWSAGVSVSVIAHEEVTPRSPTSTAPSDGAPSADVFYLCLWRHQQSSVRAMKAAPAPLSHMDGGAEEASEFTSAAYLRFELPRCAPPPLAMEAKDAAAHDSGLHRDAVAKGDAAYATEANAPAATATASANVWLPTITRACRKDVVRAVAKARQQQAEAAQEVREQARKSQGGATDPPHPPSSSALSPCVHCEVAATVVLGMLFSPSAGTMRLRLNNYTEFEEITVGLGLGNQAEAATATASASPPAPVLPPRLYPAATLSLNESGWRSWCDHQTRKWTRLQQQEAPQTNHNTPLPPTSSLSSSWLSVSNAVLRFSFDVSELLLGPPLPHQAGIVASTGKIGHAAEAAHLSQKAQEQGRVREPIGARAPQPAAPLLQTSQPIALLDSSVKFAQMLSVLTDVSLLAAVKQSGNKSQQQQQLFRLGNGDVAAVEDEEDEAGSAAAVVSRGAAPPAHLTVSLASSRDRRSRAAMMWVQRLLNTPGGGAVNTSADSSSVSNACDSADVFFPPIRIFRHSCHCPPHELYPLSTSSSGTGDAVDAEERSRRTQQQQQRRQRRGNRLIGLGGAGTGSHTSVSGASSLLFANACWHDIVPENARLTPLCAALASRQRTMAYVIATHPLTRFCSPSGDEVITADSHMWQQEQHQPQQRRTALYAACALRYVEVVQVLLERIPVEELLSYFGLVIESEARAALQRCYAKANAMFLQSYRLRMLTAQSSSTLSDADRVDSNSTAVRSAADLRGSATANIVTAEASKSGGSAAATSTPAVPYLTNGKQRALLDVSTMYSSSRSSYTPLHVALLGVVLENGDEDNEGFDESDAVDEGTEEAYMSSLNARLSRQTACVTVLLNCLYDLLCVAPASNATALKSQECQTAPPEAQARGRRLSLMSRELLADALNLQSRTGETALLLAVRHNNVPIALRLLKLGAQPACMDRVTRLLSLELACANRCTPIAEALLQPHNAGGVADSTVNTSVYATSPVLLNHAGIATALCWCAINNMPSVMQRLLACDGVDVESGFEGSSPLHLAIAFGSEAAALTLLNGTQPRKATTVGAHKGRSGGAEAAPVMSVSGDAGQRGACEPVASTARPTTTVSVAKSDKKQFMDVNIPHERTRCTPLHLACERGQLDVIRVLLQSWHAQLNVTAAYTNNTPLLTAVGSGREEAALRVLEYSKDQLRRGRAVLDLCAVDQNGDTALHLAASRGLALALEYMLVQFSEEEVTLLATLHPTLSASPAYQKAICIVPVHAVNKQGKTALLAAVQRDQAETAELLVSMFIDSAEAQKVGDVAVTFGSESGSEPPNSSIDVEVSSPSASEAAAASASSSLASPPSQLGGPLIDGTCMALHQAHRKHLDSVVQLMLSAPPGLFPCTAAFRKSVQAYKRQEADRQHSAALSRGVSSNGNVHPASAVGESGVQSSASTTHKNASQRSPAVAQDRGSFVRLMLTRAAGPTISPKDALHLLLRGFALPELFVYLSEVAVESAALGVQRGTAMAYSELLIGYLQEHAGSVVAPTRAVIFCRDVLLCLQQWMLSEASVARERLVASRCHRTRSGGVDDLTRTQLLPDIEKSDKLWQKKQDQSDLEEAPMGWLCRVLLVPDASVGDGVCSEAERRQLTSPVSAPSSSVFSAGVPSAAEEAQRYRDALETTLKRKTLSLEVARMIRLHGRSNGGARAIEEIKSLVQAHVKTKVNARSKRVGRATAATGAAAAQSPTQRSSSSSRSSLSALTYSCSPKNMRDVAEEDAAEDRDGSVDLGVTTAARSKHPARRTVDVVGNELLFTTPMGFTVLQLAATLSLPDVVAFLVKAYKLDPLYAPAQRMYTGVTRSAAQPPQPRHSNAGAQSDNEAARVREVVARTVRALAGTVVSYPDRGDFGSANGGASTIREDGSGWFCWTPYRLAVRSGNTLTVETLLLAGDVVVSTAGVVAEAALREVRYTSTPTSVLRSGKGIEDRTAVGDAGATAAAATLPASVLVDYKEPVWLDPYQRTALQERIVAATTCGSAPPASSSSSSTATTTAPTLPETLAMVYLLLKHGAQPNGLFDSTGSDAWLLAVAGSGAADLPITLDSSTIRCRGACRGKSTLLSADTRESFSRLSPSKASPSMVTSLLSIRTSAGETAGQRCVDLLLRFPAPPLERAPASRSDPGTRHAGAPESAESQSFDEELLRHAHRLLYQWQRLPCMRLEPTRTTAARSARTSWRVSGTGADMRDGNGSKGCDAADDNRSGAARHGNSVFEEADALCAQHEGRQRLLYASAEMTSPCGDGATSLSYPTHAATLAWSGSFTSLSAFTSAQEMAGLSCATASGRAMAPDRKDLTSRHASEADSLAEREPATPPSAPTASVESRKTQLIAALRLCYRVALLYTCVEYAPLQLLQLVRVFGTAAIPLSARHPLSGDSVTTRLLRKTHARLLAGTSGGGGGSRDSSPPQGGLESDGVSLLMRNSDKASALAMSVLREPPCTSDPVADPEARVLVDTCMALVHVLSDAANRLPSAPPETQSQATSVAATAARCALCSVLFQPSCDGETTLSLAARIAYAPLISVLVQSGAAASAAPCSRNRGRHRSWRDSHKTCMVPRRGDGDDTEARDDDGAGVYDVSGLPVSSRFSLSTNLADVVVRALLATRVYYPTQGISTLRVLLRHMPHEPARRAFLRSVYPNVHPLPALQLAMENVEIASEFLTTSDCMNALWTNLLYAHFTHQLNTAVRATAKAWNALLRVVLPGAPAVPIYLVMCAAVRDESSAEALNASRSSMNARSSQAVPSLPQRQQSLASLTRSRSTAGKLQKARPAPSETSNWSHVVRRTNLFLQLMSMSVAETLMNKNSQSPPHVSAAANTLSPIATKAAGKAQRVQTTSPLLHEVKRAGSFSSLTNDGQSPSHGLSGTLLWDTIELAVRYDDKDMLRYLLQLRLPDVVIKHINSIQQQQALPSTGTFGGTHSSLSASTRAMEAASAAILANYPSFAGVSTTSQATLVLERLQRLLWWEALQERHVDLLAVAAGSVATLRFLHMSSPPEVRSQMTSMRYDRIDVQSGTPEGVSHAPDIVAPVAASTASTEELMGALQKAPASSLVHGATPSECHSSRNSGFVSPLMASVVSSTAETPVTAAYELAKSPFSAGDAIPMLSADGRAWPGSPTPASPVFSAAEWASSSIVVNMAEAPDERSGTFPRADAPQLLQLKTGQHHEEKEESLAAVADAELHFMESCVQNGRRRLAAVEERRRRVTSVTWGLGATACALRLPRAQSNADTSEVPATSGPHAGMQSQRTPTQPSLTPKSAASRAADDGMRRDTSAAFLGRVTAAPRAERQRRITPNDSIGDAGPGDDMSVAITAASTAAARRAVQRRGRPKVALPIKAMASAKEAGGKSPRSPTPPPVVAPEAVYFMYLQLDWALHSTRLLRSPRPSSGTLETILFLLDQRAALSVPVVDLFLSGTAAPSSAAAAAPQQDPGKVGARPELALSLRYQTREHGDTLLHLLVIHDQCQLAEYYLDYCHLWFVSNALDPEPVSGRPGRFPIDEAAMRLAHNPSGDSLHDDGDNNGSRLRSGGGYSGREAQEQSTYVTQQQRPHSRGFSSRIAEVVPCEFLRCMLRVNAHGLTAFDYARTPAMLQLLQWYGCVPPTYRPNPRAFQRVVLFDPGNGREHGDVREAYTFVGGRGDDGGDGVVDRRTPTSRSTSETAPRRRKVLRFFPVPRLILATDNFVALMDPTGTELASTIGTAATSLACSASSGTTERQSGRRRAAADGSVTEDDVLVAARTRQQQLNDRQVAAMLNAEQRHLQSSRQRRQQQERAKAHLFEQVAAQSHAIVASDSGSSSEAYKSVRSGALPYLTRAVTAQRRQQWEVQRHPPCNEMALWHNALEAQRLSASAFAKAPVRGQLRQRKVSDDAGSDGGVARVLPILLSEEVSLLHIGLCSFADELVRLYGELQTVSASAPAAGHDDSNSDTHTRRTGDKEVDADSDGANDDFALSAYSRLLLPPSVIGSSAAQQQKQQQEDHEEGKSHSDDTQGGAPREMSHPRSTRASKTSRTDGMAPPRAPAAGEPIGGALPPTQQGPRLPSASATNAAVATSESFRPREGASTLPRLSQLDVVFLLECQQFVVYPLSLPGSNSAVGIVDGDDDDPHEEDTVSRSRARGGNGLSVGIGNAGRPPGSEKKKAAPSLSSLGKRAAGVDELPAVVKRCTGGSTDTAKQQSMAPGSGALIRGTSSSSSTVRGAAGRSPSPSRQPYARREREGSVHDAPPSDLPLLSSFLARKAVDDQSSQMVDISAHRYDAALLVSLTPMLLSSIGGSGDGARTSAAASMRNLAERLMDTRWKQFGSRPVTSGTGTGAATSATEVVALLNVPPFTRLDALRLQSHRVPFSATAAADERRPAMSTEASGSAATRVPTDMAARLEEWVARRWPPHEPSPRLPSTYPMTAHRQMNEDKGLEDSYEDDEGAVLSVLDKASPVGGVATTAQQALMRALLKRFTAATGAQLSEQMGLIITPNYDVEEVGDTAAALRDIEAKAAALPAARKKRR